MRTRDLERLWNRVVARGDRVTLLEASAAAKRVFDARIQAQIGVYFGRLSERELAIWRHAWRVAYARGMKRGRADQRKAAA